MAEEKLYSADEPADEEAVSSEGDGGISKAFEVLEDMLSSEEGQKQISDIISAFSQGNAAAPTGQKEEKSPIDDFSAIFSGLNAISAQKSRSAALLEALKPFLKKERQEKLDTVIKLSRALGLMKQLGFLNKGGGENL